jgi:hypothetical protein
MQTCERELKIKIDTKLGNKRIIQLELQAYNEYYMNRTYTYCLESLVVSLEN